MIDKNKSRITEIINSKALQSTEIEAAIHKDKELAASIGEANIQLLSQFIADDRKKWGHEGKKVINKEKDGPVYFLRPVEEIFGSEILSVSNVPNSSSGAFGDLGYAICRIDGLFDELEKLLLRPADGKRLTQGENILYYGAPGTGKSYAASKEAGEDLDCVFRTLFHPDMQNSDFFGTLKPATDEKGQPIYKFREGPFAKALAHARDNPSKRVYLIIEELNRAMAAAVFGELFQLLDRDADGTSEYSVDAPSDEFAESYGAKKIKLPSNLWILATMNSADQGVYPLDTAFRRRWRQVYIPIDYSIAPKNSIRISTVKNPDVKVSWPAFVERLNKFLTAKIDIPEDRLIGPRFVKELELEGGTLPSKLLIYLWDDLLRHHGRHTLFTATLKTYGELDRANSEGKPIFNQAFLDALELEPFETQAV